MGREIIVEKDFEEEVIDKKEEIYGKEESQRLSENTLIQRLMEAANYKNDENQWIEIEIVRPKRINGEVKKVTLFTFRVRALSDDDVEEAKKRSFVRKYPHATDRLKKKEKVFDEALYQSNCIYTATVEEDKKKIWDNPTFQSQIGEMRGVYTVDLLLKVGEKEMVMDALNMTSAFKEDESISDIDIKN